MFIGCVINTFSLKYYKLVDLPLQSWKVLDHLLGHSSSLSGTISLKTHQKPLDVGQRLFSKIAVSVVLGLLVAKVFNDNFLGLSAVAVIGAISVANNAMYAGIVDAYGDEIDAGAVGITTWVLDQW